MAAGGTPQTGVDLYTRGMGAARRAETAGTPPQQFVQLAYRPRVLDYGPDEPSDKQALVAAGAHFKPVGATSPRRVQYRARPAAPAPAEPAAAEAAAPPQAHHLAPVPADEDGQVMTEADYRELQRKYGRLLAKQLLEVALAKKECDRLNRVSKSNEHSSLDRQVYYRPIAKKSTASPARAPATALPV